MFHNGSMTDGKSGVAGFTSDVVNLAELHVRLAAVNGAEALQKAKAPTAVIVLSVMVVAGAVPVVLLGAAWLLASALSIAQGWAMVVVAVAAAAVAAPAALVAIARLRRCFESFRSSRDELHRNLTWLHAVLDPGATEPAPSARPPAT